MLKAVGIPDNTGPRSQGLRPGRGLNNNRSGDRTSSQLHAAEGGASKTLCGRPLPKGLPLPEAGEWGSVSRDLMCPRLQGPRTGGASGPRMIPPVSVSATGTLELGEHPNRLKTHCPAGHPYAGENLYVDPQGYRRCRACKRQAREAKLWRETRGRSPYRALIGPRRPNQNVTKPHCPNGHPYSGENLYVDPKGNRRCRACKKEQRSKTDHKGGRVFGDLAAGGLSDTGGALPE